MFVCRVDGSSSLVNFLGLIDGSRLCVGFAGRVYESRLPVRITNCFVWLELVFQFYDSSLWVNFHGEFRFRVYRSIIRIEFTKCVYNTCFIGQICWLSIQSEFVSENLRVEFTCHNYGLYILGPNFWTHFTAPVFRSGLWSILWEYCTRQD